MKNINYFDCKNIKQNKSYPDICMTLIFQVITMSAMLNT